MTLPAELRAEALEWEIAGWLPLASAPKDGTRVRLINIGTGVEDVGSYHDWGYLPDWHRAMLPDHCKDWAGEWCQDNGNGDMTHWRPLDAPLPATPEGG